MTIEGAEITVYFDIGENISLDLNETQLKAVLKLLGVKIKGLNVYYYSDETLQRFLEMEKNPLRLVENGE